MTEKEFAEWIKKPNNIEESTELVRNTNVSEILENLCDAKTLKEKYGVDIKLYYSLHGQIVDALNYIYSKYDIKDLSKIGEQCRRCSNAIEHGDFHQMPIEGNLNKMCQKGPKPKGVMENKMRCKNFIHK